MVWWLGLIVAVAMLPIAIERLNELRDTRNHGGTPPVTLTIMHGNAEGGDDPAGPWKGLAMGSLYLGFIAVKRLTTRR